MFCFTKNKKNIYTYIPNTCIKIYEQAEQPMYICIYTHMIQHCYKRSDKTQLIKKKYTKYCTI